MYTRNTKTLKKARVSVGKALGVLHMLTREDTQLVLNYFTSYSRASYLDLLVHTQLDAEHLERLLEELMETNVLIEDCSVYGTEYELNGNRLRNISRLTKKLSNSMEKTIRIR